MNKITSVKNQIIIEISKLKNTKDRKASGLFCAEGFKLAKEAIAYGFTPLYCFISEKANYDAISQQLNICSDSVYIVTEQILKKISSLTTPPEIILIAKLKDKQEYSFNENAVIALDAIQDPSNMGAILRSAEAFGMKSVLIGDGCTDVYSAKSIRGAMGSTFRLNIVTDSLTKVLPEYKKNGFTIIGTGLDRNFKTVDKLSSYCKKVLIIGNEGNGISDSIKDLCDFGMFIPMSGKNESLNAAVAASIIMWENQRQIND